MRWPILNDQHSKVRTRLPRGYRSCATILRAGRTARAALGGRQSQLCASHLDGRRSPPAPNFECVAPTPASARRLILRRRASGLRVVWNAGLHQVRHGERTTAPKTVVMPLSTHCGHARPLVQPGRPQPRSLSRPEALPPELASANQSRILWGEERCSTSCYSSLR
jgi:hypothetical protein